MTNYFILFFFGGEGVLWGLEPGLSVCNDWGSRFTYPRSIGIPSRFFTHRTEKANEKADTCAIACYVTWLVGYLVS